MWANFEAKGDSMAMAERKKTVLRRLAAVVAAVEGWSTDPEELEDALDELGAARRLIKRMMFDFDPDTGSYPEER